MANSQAHPNQENASLEEQNQDLRARLQEAEDALRAIRSGEVDALVVYGKDGEHIYTLQGADFAYRVMVESIHEGAANISEDGTILYCNKRLAEMLDMPLETVLGTSFNHYLLDDEQEIFAELSRKGLEDYGRAEINLVCRSNSTTPVLVTASAAQVDGHRGISLVITDLTEQKQAAARERELQARLMEQREEERVHIARNLHDGPLQDLLGLSYLLQDMIAESQKSEEEKNLFEIRANILKLAGDLRGVCNDLRPPNTIRFGLSKAIRYHIHDFQERYPEIKVKLDLIDDGQMVPQNTATALYRIYQECMANVVRHAEASLLTVRLGLENQFLLLEVEDNGSGFTPPKDWSDLARGGHLGLVGMRERAEAAGGKLRIITELEVGTTIQVKVPLPQPETPDAQERPGPEKRINPAIDTKAKTPRG